MFAARFDSRETADLWMLLKWLKMRPDVEFAVLSGGHRSNNDKYLRRANEMAEQGKLTIMADLKKNDYYNVVNDSKVLFNCALQDWVSNTVSEADALGCNVVYLHIEARNVCK